MRLKHWIGVALALVPLQTHAQDVSFSPAATETCLASAAAGPAQLACVGLSAASCMASSPGGGSTFGAATCFSEEGKYWDDRLNAAYKPLMAKSRNVDAEMAELGANVLSTADTLRNMQRAWIPFRDAACRFEYSQWGGGSGAGPGELYCHMQLTAEQALRLERYLNQ